MRGEKGPLVEGTHWVREKRHVLFTEKGLEALKKMVGAGMADGEKNGQEEALALVGAAVLMVVTSVPKVNRRILCARKKEGEEGGEMRVRVRDNINFMPGMELRARPDANYADIYVLEGRTPRYRGRW